MAMGGRMSLCANCLEGGARSVEVGPDRGSQREPFRDMIPLCPSCEAALIDGDMKALAGRYRESMV